MSIRCTKCNSEKFKKNGIIRDTTQQYKCKVCGARFSFSQRRKNYDEKKYLAISLHLSGVSYKQISRELKVSDVAVRNWTLKLKNENPLLYCELTSKEKVFPHVKVIDLNDDPEFIRSYENSSGGQNGGIFIESHSRFLQNKILHIELVPRGNSDTSI